MEKARKVLEKRNISGNSVLSYKVRLLSEFGYLEMFQDAGWKRCLGLTHTVKNIEHKPFGRRMN